MSTTTELESKLTVTDKYKGNEVLVMLMRQHSQLQKCLLVSTNLHVSHLIGLFHPYLKCFTVQLFILAIKLEQSLLNSLVNSSTQMTLNTFHFAGVAFSKNVNQGVLYDLRSYCRIQKSQITSRYHYSQGTIVF